MKRLGLLLGMALWMTGCASTSLIDYAPDAYLDAEVSETTQAELIGQKGLFGGEIASVTHENGDTLIELTRFELNTRGYPMRFNPVDGHKVVVRVANSRMNRNYYEPGSRFSAVGEITDIQFVTLAGRKQTLIMLESEYYRFWPREDRLWRDDDPFCFNAFGCSSYYGAGYGFWR